MLKVIKNLEEAEKEIRAVDHILTVTLPLINEQKILLKILPKIKNSLVKTINAILQYEYLLGTISLSKDREENIKKFIRISRKYEITKYEIDRVKEIFDLAEKQKSSATEFKRGNKMVIFSENFTETIDEKKAKEYLDLSKEIYKKTFKKIGANRL